LISEEAKKGKLKFQRVGMLIKTIALNPTKLSKLKVTFQRLNYLFIVGYLSKKAKGHNYEKVSLGGISTWKITTENSDPNKILLYFHGGAYVAGDARSYYPMMTHICKATDFTIYVPNYRLAPEHHYPSQLEDGIKSYKALINDLNLKPQQIAFGGDSAGGNLALVTLLKLKENNDDLPFAIFCLSPWADPLATGDTYNLEMCDKDAILGPIFKTAWTKYNSKAYLTYYVKDEDMDENNPYICPIKGDFTNSPPILIHVGTEELLLSDSRSMINALERDNVEYEYKEWDELWHVFQLESLIPEAQESFSLISKFLNKYI